MIENYDLDYSIGIAKLHFEVEHKEVEAEVPNH